MGLFGDNYAGYTQAPMMSKEEISMANMAEDVKKRFDALLDFEQRAVEAIMEAWDYSIEDALDVVESGRYGFCPGITSMADLAYKHIHDRGWFGIDPHTLAKIGPYIDYDRLGEILYDAGHRVTSFGAILIFEDSPKKNKIKFAGGPRGR